MKVKSSLLLLILVLVYTFLVVLPVQAVTGSPKPDFRQSTYPTLPSNGPKIQLELAHCSTESSPNHIVMLKFKEVIEGNSNRKITVNIYPNSQLGSDSEIAISCRLGNIPMIYQASSTHVTLVPEASLFDTPFLLTNYSMDVIERVCINSPFREMFNSVYGAADLKLLTLSAALAMNLSSNKSIESMNDLRGLKIRTAQSESRMKIWSALGANPTPLAYSEVYMALQQGLVTASDNTFSNMVSAKLVEQQKYILKSQHSRPSFSLLMSKKRFDKLPEEYQKYILAVCKDINSYEFSVFTKDELESERVIREKYKLKFCEISDSFMAEMQDRANPAIDAAKKMVKNNPLFDLLVKNLKEYSSK